MHVLNFSYPLTKVQIAQTETLASQSIDQVIQIPVQFDVTLPFNPQFQKLADSIPLTPTELQTEPILVVLPSLNYIAALLLAELHGRMGFFPAILRLRPVAGAIPPVFETAEIINLQALRDAARDQRYK